MQVSYAAQQSLKTTNREHLTSPIYKSMVFGMYVDNDPHQINFNIYCVATTMQLNTGQTGGPAGRDLNVVPAWMQGFTGKGVVVAVVDDGRMMELM